MGTVFSFGRDKTADLVIDFDAAIDGESNAACTAIESTLATGKEQLALLEAYEGGSELIRQAMSKNTDQELQKQAFHSILPNVDAIKSFYDTAELLQQQVKPLLLNLANSDSFESEGYSTKTFCEMLTFVLKFDGTKMMKPNVQNDFSFYRRTLGKMAGDPAIRVPEGEANMVSMFIANNAPLMNAVVKGAKEANQQNLKVKDAVATIANVCCSMIFHDKCGSDETKNNCLHAMVGAIVLYDHTIPTGAFYRSQIQMKKCLKCLTAENQEQLKAVVKYNTLHFKDSTTPSSLRSQLE